MTDTTVSFEGAASYPENGETKRHDAAAELQSRLDGWTNVFTGLGVDGKDHREGARYKGGRIIEHTEYDRMYETDPVFARIVDTLPMDATRKWIKILTPTDEDEDGRGVDEGVGQSVIEKLEELGAQSKFAELFHLARLDGGGAMILGADDGQSPEEPLDPNRITNVAWLAVVSALEIFPRGEINNDPSAPNFRLPEFWTFTGQGRTLAPEARTPLTIGDSDRIHWTRVIPVIGIKIGGGTLRRSGSQKNFSEVWGVPIVQRVKDDLRQYNNVYQWVEASLKDMTHQTVGIKDLAGLLMSDQGSEFILSRLKLLQFSQSTLNMSVHDSEQEVVTRTSAAISGIAPIIASFQDKLAAASELPLTKLFGHAPSGLSTDDQSGTRNYNASVANAQENKLRDPIRRVIDAILHSKEGPTDGQIPENWSFIFNPLDEPTEQENAARAKTEAETDKILIDAKILRPSEARSRIANDPESIYSLEAEAVGESAEEIEAEANQPLSPAIIMQAPQESDRFAGTPSGDDEPEESDNPGHDDDDE